MANFDAQLARMRELAGYNGVNTGNAPKKTSVNESNFEYQMIGPDGKSYAIVRESKYYYIKSADADKKNLAEAYDYLGGWMGRKNYEYNSYAKALKNFELKMRSLNEAYDVNATVEVLNPTAKNSILNEATEDMRKEIARQREIMVRAGLIREGKEIGATRKDDVVMFDGKNEEAPTGKCGNEDYKSAEKPLENKDFKKKASQSSKEDGDTYTEKPKSNKKDYVAEGCYGPFTKNVNECGKALNEEDADFEADEEDADFEADEKDADFEADEKDADFEADEKDADFDDDEEDADFDDDEEDADFDDDEIPVDENDPEAIRAEIERLQARLDDMEDEESDAEDMSINSDMETEEEPVLGEGEDFKDEDEYEDFEDEMSLNEAKARFMNGIVNTVVKSIVSEERTTLHDFGKHPGYRKKVMSLPKTGADKTEHGEDWNDETVHNEKPFGEKIGSSAPFDKAVEAITNAVISELKKK